MNEIERICRELMAEADAIIKYTEDLTSDVLGQESAKVIQDIRADEFEHLQALMVLLGMQLKEGGTDG